MNFPFEIGDLFCLSVCLSVCLFIINFFFANVVIMTEALKKRTGVGRSIAGLFLQTRRHVQAARFDEQSGYSFSYFLLIL